MVYLDNCATTRVDDEVLNILIKYHTEQYFNPSARSNHSLSVANDLAKSRENIAKLLGASSDEIVFTSGGTESDNLAVFGSLRSKHGNIVLTASEHSAVYNSAMELQSRGYEVRLANVLPDGHIDVDDFIGKIDEQTLLACFMHVNNETGAINDIKLLTSAVKGRNPATLTFADGVQAVGKIPVNVKYFGVDMYSFSGHKIHASKGTGALYVKHGITLNPVAFGGGQERGLRSGTEYVGGFVALSTALSKATSLVKSNATKYDEFKRIIRDELSSLSCWKENCTQNCSPAIMSLAFENIKGEVLLHMLEDNGYIVGTGSACSSKNKQSRIAKAINLDAKYTEGIIRISFSKYNTTDEIQDFAKTLFKCVCELRKTMLGE